MSFNHYKPHQTMVGSCLRQQMYQSKYQNKRPQSSAEIYYCYQRQWYPTVQWKPGTGCGRFQHVPITRCAPGSLEGVAEDWAMALFLICFLKVRKLPSASSFQWLRAGRSARLWGKAPRCSAGMSGGEQPQSRCALGCRPLDRSGGCGGRRQRSSS